MNPSVRSALFLFIGSILLFFCLPNHAVAASTERNRSLYLSGGLFLPYEGDSSVTAQGGLQFRIKPSLAVGVELEYRQFKTEVFDVPDVRTTSVGLRGILNYLILPEGITPYLGVGYGFSVNTIDADRVERQRPGLSVSREVGLGTELLGAMGVWVPVDRTVSFFLEGRAGVVIQLSNSDDELDVENLGGLSGLAGVRFHF